MTQTPDFLSLPLSIRQRIYRLVVSETVFRFSSSEPADAFLDRLYRRKRRHDSIWYHTVPGLLLASSHINSELTDLLYHNRLLVLRVKSPDDFFILRRFRPLTWSKISRLTVIMQEKFCMRDGFWEKTDHRTRHLPLRRCTGRIRTGVQELDYFFENWAQGIGYVLQHIVSDTFRLAVACDIATVSMVGLVVDPILASCKILADFAIKFGIGQDLALREMAKEVMQQLTESSPRCTAGFPFHKLPTELRSQILQYTDLVTPERQVIWKRDAGFSAVRNRYTSLGSRLVSCNSGMHSSNCTYSLYRECFCRIHHSVAIRGCHCWEPPTSLFLVCRTLTVDAQTTFFGSNRIIIGDELATQNIMDSTALRASLFFSQMKNILHHLRHLEIVLPQWSSLEKYSPTGVCRALADWECTISDIGARFDSSKLNFYIVVPLEDHWHESHEDFINLIDVGKGQRGLEMCCRLLQPLADLPNLRRMHLFIGWPWHQSRMTGKGHSMDSVVEKMFSEYDQYGDREGFFNAFSKVKSLSTKVGHQVMGASYDSMTDNF